MPTPAPGNDLMGTDMARMMAIIPVEQILTFTGGPAPHEQLEALPAASNAS